MLNLYGNSLRLGFACLKRIRPSIQGKKYLRVYIIRQPDWPQVAAPSRCFEGCDWTREPGLMAGRDLIGSRAVFPRGRNEAQLQLSPLAYAQP